MQNRLFLSLLLLSIVITLSIVLKQSQASQRCQDHDHACDVVNSCSCGNKCECTTNHNCGCSGCKSHLGVIPEDLVLKTGEPIRNAGRLIGRAVHARRAGRWCCR